MALIIFAIASFMPKLHTALKAFSNPLCAIHFIIALECCVRVLEGRVRAPNGDPVIKIESG